MEDINWEYIPFNELDILIRLSDHSRLNEELRGQLTPLCLACKFNREDLVTILIHHGAQADKRTSLYGRLPLHFACSHHSGNCGIVRKLIEARADINAQDDDGNTALHMACTESNIPVAELLLEHGASVSLTDIDGETPLFRACLAMCIELVDILLKAGSDPNVFEGFPFQVPDNSDCVTLLNRLIAAGADLQKGSYLSDACMFGHKPLIKTLLESGSNVNRPNIIGMSPLHSACTSSESSTGVVRLLLEWGADVDAQTSLRLVPLHLACDTVQEKKIKLLLAYGADVNARDGHRQSPLMRMMGAIQNSLKITEDQVRIVSLLIAAGSRVSKQELNFAAFRVLSAETTSRECTALLEALDSLNCDPPDLQSQCRVVVRKLVPPNIDENVHKLPLPPQIIRFLKFCDIK